MTRQELLDLGNKLRTMGVAGPDRFRRAWERGLDRCGAPPGFVGVVNLNVGYIDEVARSIQEEIDNPDFCKHGYWKPVNRVHDEFSECGECEFEELVEMADKELRW